MTEVLFALRWDHWRNGYASEAARALLQVRFDELAPEQVVATVEPSYRASVAVLRRQGFVLEGSFQHTLSDAHAHLYRVTRSLFERACRESEAP